MKLIWNEYVHFIPDKEKIFIGNTMNKECIFITKECYQILKNAMKEDLSEKQLVNSFQTEKERQYIKDLMEILMQKRMIGEFNYSELFKDNLKITWAFTDKCNLRCKHCANSSGERKRGKELEKEELLSIADKICALHPKSICLTGGEPLDNPYFWEIVDSIKREFQGNLKLMTNGTLINEKNASRLADQFFSFDISLDGADEESCAKVRGSHVFEKVVQGIKLLKKHGAKRIVVSMVDCRATHKYIQAFKDLCENELDVQYMVRGFDSVGRGEENKKELENLLVEIRESDLDGNKEKKLSSIKKQEGKFMPDIFGCKAALMEFYIDYRGQIFPCPVLDSKEFLLGNALQEDLKQYIFEKQYTKSEGYGALLKYLPWNLPECAACKNQLFCYTCIGDIKDKYESGIIKNCNKRVSFQD